MAAFKANKRVGEDNCLLFHCPAEADCPLMKAPEGSNTYDIYKGEAAPPPVSAGSSTASFHYIVVSLLPPSGHYASLLFSPLQV